jgi:hypothetical protein
MFLNEHGLAFNRISHSNRIIDARPLKIEVILFQKPYVEGAADLRKYKTTLGLTNICTQSCGIIGISI